MKLWTPFELPHQFDFINWSDYTELQIWLYIVDTIFWVVAYGLIIRDIFKHKFVGMPWVNVCSNLGWELMFSVVVASNLGVLFHWGGRLWLVADLVILYGLLKYGKQQVAHPWVRKHFYVLVVVQVAAWCALTLGIYRELRDVIGGITGYMLNVYMSAMYIVMLLRNPRQPAWSLSVAIAKMFGTFVIGVASFVGPTPEPFILVMCVVTLGLDLTYIGLLLKRKSLPRIQLSVVSRHTPTTHP